MAMLQTLQKPQSVGAQKARSEILPDAAPNSISAMRRKWALQSSTRSDGSSEMHYLLHP
jgi:hypothetical protein